MPSFAKTYKFNNMKKILQVTILFSLLTVGSFAQKQQQILPADQEIPLKYGANRLGKRSDAAMKKFRDNRLGAFIHWGLYAIPGGEWNGKMYNGAAEWLKSWAKVPADEWLRLMDQWNPEKFNAKVWAKMARKMGVKYVKITTKHHEGFCLWPSKYSNYTVAQTPYKKDILGELVKAYNDEGIDVHFYFSVMDWSHPDYRYDIKSKDDEVAFARFLEFMFKDDFPREYQTWTETAKTDFESEFNGNVAVDALEKRPEMVILWAGYAFSKDYSTPRGHMHAIEDITASLRTGAPVNPTDGPQPSTCWTCKSPDVPRMMEALGVDSFYNNKWGAMGAEIVNPIGCSDCHDPETMNLHISRPALIEAFQRQGKDITKATPQEMRSLVCAQCHVEYYFKGDGKYLTFPWDKGFTVEDMEAYYDEAGFYDYIHKLSRTPILKAQHPDYEIAQMGIHGQRGVSCADCHMPYKSEGGVKFSDHHIQSPLAMIDRTCQVCHRESEETLRNNVYERQRKANEIRNRLEQELAKAHIEAKYAWDNGATEEQMKNVLALIRQAQWRWDFGVASHGGAFHAPQEIQRILSHGLDRAMQARLAVSKVLAKNGFTGDVPMPDISTKGKAQQYIGLDIDAEKAAKERFLKTTVPAWLEKAKSNGRLAQK